MEQKEQKQPLSEQELEQVSGGGGGVIPQMARMVCPLCNRYVTHLTKHQESGCSDYLCEGTPTIVF